MVWLKAVFVGGKQIGVGTYCPAAAPCEWHAALAKVSNSGYEACRSNTRKRLH